MLHRMIGIRLSGLEQISWGAASTCPLAAKAIRAMARLRGGAFTIAVTAALLCVIATRSSAHPAKGQVDAWLAHARAARQGMAVMARSEEHTSELQSLMRISYAVFCLNKHTETQ